MSGPAKDGVGRVEWYEVIFELIDMRSFSNLWYWIALAVLWSSASHWVLGVPFDMITRAKRQGGDALVDLQDIVRVNVNRLLYIGRTSGLWLIGITCFMMTMLVILGFIYDMEFAQAVLFLFVPMTFVGMLSLRTARLIEMETANGTGPGLHRRLMRHRMAVQAIGMVSIFCTSLFGMWQNMQLGAFG